MTAGRIEMKICVPRQVLTAAKGAESELHRLQELGDFELLMLKLSL